MSINLHYISLTLKRKNLTFLSDRVKCAFQNTTKRALDRVIGDSDCCDCFLGEKKSNPTLYTSLKNKLAKFGKCAQNSQTCRFNCRK